jgi:hypothetical protein
MQPLTVDLVRLSTSMRRFGATDCEGSHFPSAKLNLRTGVLVGYINVYKVPDELDAGMFEHIIVVAASFVLFSLG